MVFHPPEIGNVQVLGYHNDHMIFVPSIQVSGLLDIPSSYEICIGEGRSYVCQGTRRPSEKHLIVMDGTLGVKVVREERRWNGREITPQSLAS